MRGTTIIPTVAVVVRDGDKVLVFRRLNTGYMDGKYSLPAGHVEAGETFRQAAARELREEVGLEVDAGSLRHLHTLQSYHGPDNIRVQIFFEAPEWSGKPVNNEPQKHGDVEWIRPEELTVDNTVEFVAVGLQRLSEGQTYSELGWA